MTKDERVPTFYQYPDLVFTLQILECFCIAGLMLWARLYLRILMKKEFCHPNLRVQLVFQPLAHSTTLLLRIGRHLLEWNGLMSTSFRLNIYNFFSDFGLQLSSVIMLGMAVERVTAMVLVERYDEMWNEKPTLGYALIGITITLSLTINTGMYLSFIPKNYAYASLGLVFCTTGLAFSMLPIVAHRAYKKVKGKRDATVLQRFETGRNLQAARMLMYLAPYKVTTTLLSLTIYFFIYEKVEISLMPLCAQCYWFYNILQVFFQMLLAILCHSCLKDELYLLMGKRRKNEKRRIEDVRTVAGEAMIFDREKANLLYFESLKAAWNVREPPPATFLEIGQQSRQVALNTTRSLMKKIVVQEEKDEKRIELVDNAPPIFLVNDERVTEAEIIAAQIVNGILVQALHHFDASTTSSLLEFTTSKEIRDLCN